MKKLLLLLLCVPLIGLGQEIITNQSGKKIILNLDKTWEYLEVEKVKNDSNNRSGFSSYVELTESTRISKFLNTHSIDIVKGFDINNFEVLDYCCGYSPSFLIKDINGKTGFVSNYNLSNDNELTKLLDEKNDLNVIEKKSPLNIIGTKVEEINSAGGVDFSITWEYLDNSKDIKYLRYTVVPFNCVGDRVSGKYDNGKFTGKITGPISSGGSSRIDGRERSYWSTAWYNNTICSIKIIKVQIEYMDGTEYIYIKELPKISSPYLKHYSY